MPNLPVNNFKTILEAC